MFKAPLLVVISGQAGHPHVTGAAQGVGGDPPVPCLTPQPLLASRPCPVPVPVPRPGLEVGHAIVMTLGLALRVLRLKLFQILLGVRVESDFLMVPVLKKCQLLPGNVGKLATDNPQQYVHQFIG